MGPGEQSRPAVAGLQVESVAAALVLRALVLLQLGGGPLPLVHATRRVLPPAHWGAPGHYWH